LTGAGRSAEDFAGAFEAAFARLQVTILEACGRARDWPAQVAAGVRAGLEFAAADPAAAAVLTTGALARGADGIARHERLVVYLGERLREGRELSADGDRLPAVLERALAGGVVTLVSQRLDRGGAADLLALTPEVVQFLLTPYLGAERARRIAQEAERL